MVRISVQFFPSCLSLLGQVLTLNENCLNLNDEVLCEKLCCFSLRREASLHQAIVMAERFGHIFFSVLYLVNTLMKMDKLGLVAYYSSRLWAWSKTCIILVFISVLIYH